MKGIIIRSLFSIFIIIVSLTFFLKYRNLLPNETDKLKETLAFFFVLITILVSILEPLLKKNELPPDYYNLNKPYLETKLVIDKVTARNIIFHFVITNLGKLPAENISFNVYSQGSYSYEKKPYYDRQLPPAGKMKYNPDFFIFFPDDVKQIVIELEIFYKSIINDAEVDFRTVLNYKLAKEQLTTGIYEYDSKDEKKEPKPDIDLKFISTHTDSILEGRVGTCAFEFNEKDQSEANIIAFYSSPTKEILFDPIHKLIVFKVKLDDLIIVLRKSYYKPSINSHTVVVTWDIKKKEYSLYVDGS